MTTQTFRKGDLVIPNPDSGWARHVIGTVFVITKVPVGARGVNYVASPKDNPAARGLKGPGYAFLPHDPASQPTKPSLVDTYVPPPCIGTVVTVDHPKFNPADLFVVLGEARGGDGVRLVKLGGDEGRYWPRISTKSLTVVDVERQGALAQGATTLTLVPTTKGA